MFSLSDIEFLAFQIEWDGMGGPRIVQRDLIRIRSLAVSSASKCLQSALCWVSINFNSSF